MTTVSAEADAIAEGYEGLASGDWAAARTAFEAALAAADSPEALDGLGRALWWLRDAEGAVVNRERAYSGFRREGELGRAARIALWLSREYALVWRNDAAANGWLARAERLLADVAPGSERLARSERARDPSDAVLPASTALEVGSRTGDADLELRALAQLGLAEVAIGAVLRRRAHRPGCPQRLLRLLPRLPGPAPQHRPADRRGRQDLLPVDDDRYTRRRVQGDPATGRQIASESAEVFTVADGTFVGYWCLSNVAGLMRQLTEEQVVAAPA